MGVLERDGMAEHVALDESLRCEQGQGKNILPVQLTTSRIGNHTDRFIPNLIYAMIIHT